MNLPKPKPSMSMELWSINRWLRWTGVRAFIQVDILGQDSPTREPTMVGLAWWGWKDLFPPAKPLHWDPLKPDPSCCDKCHDPRLSCHQASDAYVFDPLAPGEDISIPYREAGYGHCGHAPKCINDGVMDDRDPLGCCNCGTRKTELAQVEDALDPQPPLAAFSRDLAALQAALPPIDAQAEARVERLLVQQRNRTKAPLHSKAVGPAANAALQPATARCMNPIKGEFGTWCKGCPYCGPVADKDSW